MSGIKDQDRIDALRKRLYERGRPIQEQQAHTLTDVKKNVPTQWKDTPKPIVAPQAHSTPNTTQSATSPGVAHNTSMAPVRKKRGYRLKLMLAGIIFFVLAVGVSSGVLLFGNNSISGENIAVAVTGPFTIGGGEVLPLQVGISNDNTVPIQAATLIVEYPLGTQSANDERTELFVERLTLDTIASGETINVPLRALVFGEENDEKEVGVSIEYRVQGSNATFFKEADPLRFKISSSPVIVRAEALKKVSSGQETDVEVTITSNAQNALSEVVIKADYPLGFDFTSADSDPVSAQNVWIIKDLEPQETKKVIIKGIVVGKETDEYAINFTVGVPNERDPQTLASVFATAKTEFIIEQPFLDIDLEIAGVVNSDVVIEPGQHSSGAIEITNTLDDTLYDITVEVLLGGNAISDLDVGPPNGFYDSLNNKIIWDVSNAPELEELFPGRSTRLAFGILPSTEVSRTPQISFDVNVSARRVSESQVAETLVGTAKSVIKVASAPQLSATINHNNGVFTDTGPLPPQAEKETTYTVSFMVENSTNDITDAVMTASLPSYVDWNNKTSGAGSMAYDPVKRIITWEIGSVDANAAAFASFQLTFQPSKSQIDETPKIVGEQRLKAKDRFTGTVVRDVSPAMTTEMNLETGYEKSNGRVVE